MDVELEIERIFRRDLKGRKIPKIESGHDGAAGNWLEEQFGIKPNGDNAPDFHGYELKKPTREKTTFGDWQADRYAFKEEIASCSRSEFMRWFGSPNKNGRYSWSGACFPTVKRWNSFGQKMFVSPEGDVFAVYSYDKDLRPDKDLSLIHI